MSILGEVVKELFGMFIADIVLTVAILALVLFVAGLIRGLGVEPLVGGAVLLAGCIAILVAVAARDARIIGRL